MAGGSIDKIELNDGLIYMYHVFSAVNIVLGLSILVQVCKNWTSAADALNPQQYKLRSPFMVSLCITLISAVLYGITILFGISDALIAWDYDALGLQMDEILMFFLVCTALTFYLALLYTYIIRLYLVYEFNRYQTCSLYLLQSLIVITSIITPIVLSYDGVQLGHTKDKSTGILLLRPKEKVLNEIFAFVHVPLFVIGYALIQLVYRSKLRNISGQKRQQLLAMLVKEGFLMLVIGVTVATYFTLTAWLKNPNSFLLHPFMCTLHLSLLYLILDFNQRLFHRFCYTFSMVYLKYCCAGAYQQNDEQILLKVLDVQLNDDMPMGNDVEYSSVMSNDELTDTTDNDTDVAQ